MENEQNKTKYLSEQEFEILKARVKMAGGYSVGIGIIGLFLGTPLSYYLGATEKTLILFTCYMLVYIAIGYRVMRLKYKYMPQELLFLIFFSAFIVIFSQVKIGILFIIMVIWLFRGAQSAYTLSKIKEFQNSLR
jgi:hypothetical protein